MKDIFTSEKNRNYVKQTLEGLKNSSLVNDPGKISIYCNDGFTVAEAVIEHVSGMSYPDFLEQRDFLANWPGEYEHKPKERQREYCTSI